MKNSVLRIDFCQEKGNETFILQVMVMSHSLFTKWGLAYLLFFALVNSVQEPSGKAMWKDPGTRMSMKGMS